MTSYHTLSFTLSHSSPYRTEESPFTFGWAARAAATALAITSATAKAAAAAGLCAVPWHGYHSGGNVGLVKDLKRGAGGGQEC
jgi:hypothetical protein